MRKILAKANQHGLYMSTVFLFGAGASYGSGSGSCSPGNPPLGNGDKGLFEALVDYNQSGYFAYIKRRRLGLAKKLNKFLFFLFFWQ